MIKKQILFVSTRNIPEPPIAGREHMMAFAFNAISSIGEVREFRIKSIFEELTLRRLFGLIWGAVVSLLSLRPMPLQLMLFYDPRVGNHLKKVLSETGIVDVYLDGVRSGIYALQLRREIPNLNIVCDFDDLMSRRISILIEKGLPISAGYLKKWTPSWVQTHLLDGALSRVLKFYERWALLAYETMISSVSDSVVLVSSVDAVHLHQICPKAKIAVIPPSVRADAYFAPLKRIKRFVFVGADSLLQNRLTIDYIINLWSKYKPKAELHLYGRLTRIYPEIDHVYYHGFVEDISQAYEVNSVLFSPSFIGGGVKTKILEAISYGAIPVGTALTFEGIAGDSSQLVLLESELIDLAMFPDKWVSRLNTAGELFSSGVVHNHSPYHLQKSWCRLFYDKHSSN